MISEWPWLAGGTQRHIISWLEAHNDTVHTTWPKEMLEGIEAKLAAADAAADARCAEETLEDTDLHPGALMQTLPPHSAVTDCPIWRRTRLGGQSA